MAEATNAKARHGAIAAYAAEIAGTDLDLDRDLESAATEHLVKTGGQIMSQDQDSEQGGRPVVPVANEGHKR